MTGGDDDYCLTALHIFRTPHQGKMEKLRKDDEAATTSAGEDGLEQASSTGTGCEESRAKARENESENGGEDENGEDEDDSDGEDDDEDDDALLESEDPIPFADIPEEEMCACEQYQEEAAAALEARLVLTSTVMLKISSETATSVQVWRFSVLCPSSRLFLCGKPVRLA